MPRPAASADAAVGIIRQGLRDRYGAGYSLAAWARERGYLPGTVWAVARRWSWRAERPTGRLSDQILAHLLADLPAASVAQLAGLSRRGPQANRDGIRDAA